jgi:hypothetical protein
LILSFKVCPLICWQSPGSTVDRSLLSAAMHCLLEHAERSGGYRAPCHWTCHVVHCCTPQHPGSLYSVPTTKHEHSADAAAAAAAVYSQNSYLWARSPS